MHRRIVATVGLLVALGTAFATAGCSSSTAGAQGGKTTSAQNGKTGGATHSNSIDKTSISVVWNSSPDVDYLPVLMAIDKLNSEGYHISAKTLAGAPEAAEALATNDAQITYDNITGAAVAVSKGAPIKAVAAISANTAAWTVFKQYGDCSQLSGKPVGIFGPAAASGYTKEMNLYFKRHCPSVQPKLVTIPDSPLRAQAMANHQIDGTVLSIGDAEHLVSMAGGPQKVTVVPMSQEFPGLADNYLYANTSTLTDHSSIIVALLSAELQAVRQIYSSKSGYQSLLAKYFKPGQYTQSSADAEYQSKTWYANGGLDSVGLTGLTQTLSAFGLPGTASNLVSTAPLQKALSAVGPSSDTAR